jgi:hypothetical protein
MRRAAHHRSRAEQALNASAADPNGDDRQTEAGWAGSSPESGPALSAGGSRLRPLTARRERDQDRGYHFRREPPTELAVQAGDPDGSRDHAYQ